MVAYSIGILFLLVFCFHWSLLCPVKHSNPGRRSPVPVTTHNRSHEHEKTTKKGSPTLSPKPSPKPSREFFHSSSSVSTQAGVTRKSTKPRSRHFSPAVHGLVPDVWNSWKLWMVFKEQKSSAKRRHERERSTSRYWSGAVCQRQW